MCFISLNNFMIYFYLEDILHLIKSPVLKVIKFGGDCQSSQDLSIYF